MLWSLPMTTLVRWFLGTISITILVVFASSHFRRLVRQCYCCSWFTVCNCNRSTQMIILGTHTAQERKWYRIMHGRSRQCRVEVSMPLKARGEGIVLDQFGNPDNPQARLGRFMTGFFQAGGMVLGIVKKLRTVESKCDNSCRLHASLAKTRQPSSATCNCSEQSS